MLGDQVRGDDPTRASGSGANGLSIADRAKRCPYGQVAFAPHDVGRLRTVN